MAGPDAALGDDARAALRRALQVELSNLVAPALYERFEEVRRDAPDGAFDRFVAESRAGGLRRLFEDKPVLLRLVASLTRQWIDASRELVARLHADLTDIRRDLYGRAGPGRVSFIEGDLSDPHNFGRSVRIVGFEDGSRVVYKPKDLRVDAAWHALVDGLNRTAPIDLRAAKVLVRAGYGWTEFVEHSSCVATQDVQQYFRRAGAWLALLHCFVSVDMHQENVIAAGAHPVPIDLEMILQGADPRRTEVVAGAGRAHAAAMQTVMDSVLTVGLLPAYGKLSNSKVFAIGGVTSNSAPRTTLAWAAVNSDAMRPERVPSPATMTNLPHLSGRHERLHGHLAEFTRGFAEYAAFLSGQPPGPLVDAFAGLPIRTVIRPTRFYYMLIQRMRDHRTMDDGITWSAQADFGARLADWERDEDSTWPLQRAERAAIVDLNVPHFVAASDGHDVRELAGPVIRAPGATGLERARARFAGLDEAELAWQLEVITQNTGTLHRRPASVRELPLGLEGILADDVFVAEADAAAKTLAEHAIRRGDGAAWIGLDWVGDSEVSQLVVLGPDLYNGACGIAVFLAAHAASRGAESSAELALAAVAPIREILHGRAPARLGRSLGVGGALGIGSLVYALAVVADLLDDATVLADAHLAAELITDELVAADRELDVLGGSAGALLALLRLHRQTGTDAVLARATCCGRHLLAQDRVGQVGERSWAAKAFGGPINGMSHGAAGYAYALSMLATATGEHAFASAAAECVAFERTSFDPAHANWRDMRGGPRDVWPCKWCYGAPGIGLARLAMIKRAAQYADGCLEDVEHALEGAQRGWPAATDTLCCGTLGTIEFHWEAGKVLDRPELCARAVQQLLAVAQAARSSGDYRWSNGTSRFNLGLFRGIAGVGYTALRRVDAALPNLLSWE
jgi:type 2 lantibiotic biosynthesis protein LanM